MGNMNQIIESSYDYFYNLFNNGECSKEETTNFIRNYLDFIFTLNNINLKFFNITIHYGVGFPGCKGSVNGLCSPSEKYENTYDIYLEDDRAVKYLPTVKNDNKKGKKSKQIQAKHSVQQTASNSNQLKDVRSLSHLIGLINTAGHEFIHLVQFIKFPQEFDDIETNLIKAEHIIADEENSNHSQKYVKKLTNKLKLHINRLKLIDHSEVDADLYSCGNFINLIDYIKGYMNDYCITDEEFTEFLNLLGNMMLKIQKGRNIDYKIYRDEEKKIIKSIDRKFNYKKSDLY